MSADKIIILGGNDTSYQLQQGLLARPGCFDVRLVHDSNYIYTPSRFYPELLSGLLPIREAALANNQYFSSQVQYLRHPPLPLDKSTMVVNTVTDAHHISVVHLPHGRRRYFTLHNTDNVIMAGAAIAQYQALVVFGKSLRAARYACAAAKAGFKTWLVAQPEQLINAHFDATTQQLIAQHLHSSKVQLIDAQQAEQLVQQHPALYTPNSAQSQGLMRIRQQLNQRYEHYPQADFNLQDGGDWYQLPLQSTEQLIHRMFPNSAATSNNLAYLGCNKANLPHRLDINDFAVHYAGELSNALPNQCLTLSIPELRVYRKVLLEDNRISGFVLAGDVRGSERLADMMMTHQDIRPFSDRLLLIGC